MVTPTKQCSFCRQELPITAFAPRHDSPIGRRSNCRACERQRERERTPRRREKPRVSEKRMIGGMNLRRLAEFEQRANAAFNGWRCAQPGQLQGRAW